MTNVIHTEIAEMAETAETAEMAEAAEKNTTARSALYVPFAVFLFFASFASFAFFACGNAPRPTASPQLRSGALAGSNVLLVTIDTLRADRVGAYGGGQLTPAIDAVAKTGMRFNRAHAHAVMTLPAHTSIMTGLVPATHGVHNNGSTALAAETPTIASALHEAGYATGAFVGAFVLDARFGLARGFDNYDDRVGADTGPISFTYAERTADRVTKAAGDWILSRNAGSKWFCWVHLFDPHAPYRAPVQKAPAAYDNEVAFADDQLGALFSRLRGAGQLDRTLIVILADHGEGLGEHGETTHGLFAYESTLRIPLIVAGPSIGAGVSDASVSQADVLPTIADLVGINRPQKLDGQSLLPALKRETLPAKPVYFEALDAYLTRNWAPLTGVIDGTWKYIDLPDAELYDIAQDPGEKTNRVKDDGPRAAALAKRLGEWPSPLAAAHASNAPIDADAAARLRALGYTAGQKTSNEPKKFTSADDPKQLLDVDRLYQQALVVSNRGDYFAAVSMFRQVITRRPDFKIAYMNFASTLIASQQPEEAVKLLEDADKRGITDSELKGRLGVAYMAADDVQHAITVLTPIARPDVPGGLEAMNTLAGAYLKLHKFDEARKLLTDLLARSPRSATTWSNLGMVELGQKRPAEAAHAFEQSLDADPRVAQSWEGLGAAKIESDPSAAVDAWRRALDLEPHNYDLLYNVAVTLHDRGRATEARPLMQRFIREAPPTRYRGEIALFQQWVGK